MFRNTYLELYKTSAASQQGLPYLIKHFTQIYNTLGCVLQDLEFQIGKMLAVPINKLLPPQAQSTHSPYNSPLRREPFRKEIKIEELSVDKSSELPLFQSKLNESSKQKVLKDDQSHIKDQHIHFPSKSEAKNQLPLDPKDCESFDSLFNVRRPQAPAPIQIERRPGIPGEMPQQSNTYEDFMQRLFREQQSRRSR